MSAFDDDAAIEQFDDNTHTAKEVEHPSLTRSTTTKRAHDFSLSFNIEEDARTLPIDLLLLNKSRTHHTTNKGIINGSRRKLITSETETPANIQEVVVADPSESTTTSTQPAAQHGRRRHKWKVAFFFKK